MKVIIGKRDFIREMGCVRTPPQNCGINVLKIFCDLRRGGL